MKVFTSNGFLATALLSLVSVNGASASTLSASLYSPLNPVGNVFTPIVLTSGMSAATTPNMIALGYTISFDTTSDEGLVKGNVIGDFAIPVAGVNGISPQYLTGGYGSALTTSEDSSGSYLSTGLGSITITFQTPQISLALLWGSVDMANKLTFNDSANYTVTGANVMAATAGLVGPGYQGAGGSAYVVVNTSTPFTTVTAASTAGSFEFLAEAGRTAAVANPEPNVMLLLGSGMIAIAFLGIRKTRKGKHNN
jgi:hypothetical protein